MKTSRFNRILSALLALVLFISNFPMTAGASDGFSISCDGKPVSRVEFFKHEKLEVSAENLPEGCGYQWQIRIPGTDTWVDIHGQTGRSLKLTYALLGSLLDGEQTAQVRCGALKGGSAVEYTAALTATVTEKPEEAPAAVPETTVPAETEAVEETTAPTIAETVPETTAPAETEAVEETTAPTVAETVPETTAPAETEAVEETTAPTVAETVPETTAPAETEAVEETAAPTVAETVPETTAPAETEAVEETTAPTVAETVPETTAPAETEAVEETTAPTVAETEPPRRMLFAAPRTSGVMAAAEGEETEIVTVTIHYRAVTRDDQFETTGEDADKQENAEKAANAADSYVAHIISGSDLDVTVPCRVIPGYKLTLPDFNPTGIRVDGNDLKLALTNVTQNLTFYAYYKEEQVSYSARYFMQNVYNDLHTERTDILTEEIRQKMKGYPGDEPDGSVIYPEIPGFSALFFQPDTIAADGSTVFEVYYDRNYYLMNYNMDGGFGTAPVYARYGTAFTVANPTKPGHVFAGWELELINGEAATKEEKAERPNHPSTIPAENRTYKAKWTKDATFYTVAYWLENANTTGYSFYSSEAVGLNAQGEPDGSVQSDNRISAADHAGTSIFGIDGPFVSYDQEKTLLEQNKRDDLDENKKVIIQGDGSTVINVYFKRNVYNLKFYYAMSTKNDQVATTDGHQYVYVIGGSTYHFGSLANNGDKGNDVQILSQYMDEKDNAAARGWVEAVPELNAYGKSVGYKMGTESAKVNNTDYIYYYLMFSAKYGQDISSKWPCDVFEPAIRANTAVDHNEWSGKEAYASAWNGEHHVWYSQNTPNNQTIKGKYQKLDYRILWDSDYGNPSDNTVSYLCFWENGTEASDITWSVPKLWYYRLWLPLLGDPPEDAVTTKRKRIINGEETEITYVLKEHYATCDDSGLDGQTFVSIDGFGDDIQDPGESDTEVGFKEYLEQEDAKKELTEKYNYTDAMFATYKEVYIADFFYGRINYRLKYHNGTGYLGNGEGALVPYGKSLALYGDKGEYASKKVMETQHYPKGYEPNAYTFEGWYTSDSFLPGTEMDWTGTMPASNLEVYAKWEPVKYTTYFYMDYDRYVSKTAYHTIAGTSHGDKMTTGSFALTPTFKDAEGNPNTEYRFVGWFYYDTDGTKKAFNPAEMAVRKELHLFAEWTTTEVSEYRISYQQGVLDTNTGEYVPVSPAVTLAEDYEGYALEATTKTFTAKAKDQLTSFPEGTKDALWLPHTNSHSIVMRSDKDENVFTFYYIKADEAPYEVRYLDAATGEPIRKDEKGEEIKGGNPHNKYAVVTETFVYIEGYIPDAFHKSLVLSANGSENEIIFYYTKDDAAGGDVSGGTEIRSRYLVTHHVPELDGTTYTSRNPEDNIGVVNTIATATELELPGFEFDAEKTKEEYKQAYGKDLAEQNVKQDVDSRKWTVSGIVTTGADEDNKPLELHLYYKRKSYRYKVEHRDWDTKDLLEREENGGKVEAVDTHAPVPFETEVSVTATNQDFTGYTLYGANDQGQNTQTLTISWDETLNVITFYYIQKKVTIHYEPVCTMAGVTGFGGVSKPLDYGTTISGSEAHAASGFRFKGWYKDADGNDQITVESWFPNSNKNYIVPKIDPNSDIYDYTYYAVFEPIETSLKIVKKVADKDVTGADFAKRATDSFLFRITGKANTSTKDVDMIVAINGSGSVIVENLNCGEYTVTELTDWSWKYNCSATAFTKKIVALTEGGDFPEANTFTFNNTYNNPDWLGGESGKENQFS